MNRLRSIIPTLIQINIVVAILSVVFIVIIREQQAQMTAYTQQSFDKSKTVPRQIKEKIVDYQETIQESHEKISNYQQQVKGLEAELKQYKKTQNGLLMQINRSNQPRNTSVASVEEQKTIALSNKPKEQNSLIAASAKSTNSRLQPQSMAKSPIVQKNQLRESERFSAVARNFSHLERAKLSNRITPENIPTEAKKIENENSLAARVPNSLPPETTENGNRQNNNNNTYQIAENTESENLSINSLEEVTTKNFDHKKIPSLGQTNDRDVSTYYANNIAYGLAIAVDEKQINHGTKMYKKVQTAIKLLRKGESKEEATRKANVPPNVMNQLIKWGEKRPASLLNETNKEQQ